ncbi:uncharacterized protein LOC129569076 [Sitodiplosis mosellana]|uniref:uncharacterized protein LOC129569076 n=1 Tax=Sitodiplosis mosellana TaxID=263140 RepID=UPI002444AB2E|nr:uncharacterized protein LOC129569076 [Sitodiplosis mosellana]
MNFGSSTNVFSMCVMKKWLIVLVLLLFIDPIPSMWAQPVKVNGSEDGGFGMRKSCGRELVARVDRICQSRGGHMTYTRARRVRRGIVNECCMNKCADHHIYAYCSNDKPERKPSDSDSLLKTPVVPREFIRFISFQPNAETVTNAPAGTVTTEDPRYHDVFLNGNIDTKTLDEFLRTLSRNSNDYEVRTVPPEFQMNNRYIPSRARIISNY